MIGELGIGVAVRDEQGRDDGDVACHQSWTQLWKLVQPRYQLEMSVMFHASFLQRSNVIRIPRRWIMHCEPNGRTTVQEGLETGYYREIPSSEKLARPKFSCPLQACP